MKVVHEVTDRYIEIDEAIAYIHRNIDDAIELSGLAKYVGYSPYHFARIFKERIGLPPLYYVSAYRLQRAKELLLNTNLSVRDIGLEIGQQSLGTFTSRFTERVGVTPSQFRNSMKMTGSQLHMLRNLTDWRDRDVSHLHGRVEGTIQSVVPFEGVILIGLFAKPIPEGLPLHGTLLSSVGSFVFTGVKPGTYYLMATSVEWGASAIDVLLPRATLRTRSREPIVVKPNTPVPPRHAVLHPPHPDDPPILISLPLLMNRFIGRVAGHENTR